MRRSGVLVVAWLVGGALAVAVATVAVDRVGNEVTGSRPAPLSAGEVEERLTAATSTTASDPSATTTTLPTTTTTNTTDTTAPVAAETRTYPLVGGTATLRFTEAGVAVVTATPNPGFSVDVEPEHGNGVQVEFESEDHESRVDGWWSGGPQDRVREEPD